ncbi:Protein of glp regulon [Erwinia amylovora Ea644]|uniref:rhomboid family intramembrane serine protease GlpG n=1 Tax=Erwinia amylovora TaxID=552 RepID=UPI0002CC06EC|nr:rhomboid family intramembrane serine protease GlpG [Erwinia amylovora]CCP04743.1 Protein of glp regulon [Erwinia amylovora Ea644]CCP08810.1 Protein of glp regulon [Erwinia amylovora MR1]
MRITHFTHLRPAQAFVDYMATRGIRLRIEQDGGYTLWLDDESQIGVVEKELNQFIRDPNHARYQAASWHAGTTKSGMHYQHTSLLANLRERAGPLSLLVIAACVLVFILMQVLGDQTVMSLLSWPDETQHYQLWRWFSHALLHFSLLHILFNLMWFWYLGGALEKRLGAGKLFVIMLISALLSGWMQAKFSGLLFGGLSGVVYALMGYSWLRGERDPDSGIFLPRGLMAFAVLWLLVGWFGWFGLSIANAAHVTGLLVGLAMAFVDTRRR